MIHLAGRTLGYMDKYRAEDEDEDADAREPSATGSPLVTARCFRTAAKFSNGAVALANAYHDAPPGINTLQIMTCVIFHTENIF
jgi:hypothetical protein